MTLTTLLAVNTVPTRNTHSTALSLSFVATELPAIATESYNCTRRNRDFYSNHSNISENENEKKNNNNNPAKTTEFTAQLSILTAVRKRDTARVAAVDTVAAFA